MNVNKKLTRNGNSTTVVLPPLLLELLGWSAGDDVELTVMLDSSNEQALWIKRKKTKPSLFGGNNAKVQS